MGPLAASRSRDAHPLMRALALVLALAGILQGFGSTVAFAAPAEAIHCLAIPDEEPPGHATDFSCCLTGCLIGIGVVLPAMPPLPARVALRPAETLGPPREMATPPEALHLLSFDGPRGPPVLV